MDNKMFRAWQAAREHYAMDAGLLDRLMYVLSIGKKSASGKALKLLNADLEELRAYREKVE